jgi:hypothetical protein
VRIVLGEDSSDQNAGIQKNSHFPVRIFMDRASCCALS